MTLYFGALEAPLAQQIRDQGSTADECDIAHWQQLGIAIEICLDANIFPIYQIVAAQEKLRERIRAVCRPITEALEAAL